MSHVNTTTHYELPIYGENDIINPLTDFNNANSAIDTAIYNVASAQGEDATDIVSINTFLGDGELETVATNATDAINEVLTATGANATAIGNVAGDVTVLENAIGDAESGLIHDVSALQTTVGAHATSIGTLNNDVDAIELDVSALQGSVVTLSGTVADVQSVISNLDGDDVAYDNTDSGLTATNVQDAVDEVNDSAVKLFSTTSTGTTLNTSITAGDNYTTPEDAVYLVYARSSGSTSSAWSLNNVEFLSSANGESEMLIPLKKNTVISTKAVPQGVTDTYTYLVKTYFQF